VVAAIRRYLQERHESNVENFRAFQPIVESARARVASLLGTSIGRVEFAPNTSYALNVLAGGLDWRPGDRVAVPSCEFPANVYPFLNLRPLGVEVDFIPHHSGAVSLEAVEQSIRPQTRLLTISWVQYLSGYRADLASLGSLCRDRGVLFCVDAIQGLGALQLDVEKAGIDFLASGAHKWMMATQGIGFLYLTEALQERIAPPAGWLHGPVDWDRLDEYELSFHPDASRFRLGTLNHVGIAALDAALELYEEADPSWCERRVLRHARHLADGLAEIGLQLYGADDSERGSGIVTVEYDDVAGLHAYLGEHGVVCAARQKKLRFSPTYYNSADELNRALEIVESYVGEA
jgi:selenocysteine lyase/cysteine desulfurase